MNRPKTPSLHSRPPLERMLKIHQALLSGKFPNGSTLAQEIEVSAKTIHRDMEFMRDRMNLPIEFNGTHNGYVNGEWFLFAFDHSRKDIRKFVPARIQAIRPTDKAFERSPKFSLEKQLRDSFGVHSGEGQFGVVIRFNARAADYIREKKWHESQQLRELKSGGVELKLKLSGLVEIERWILSWGGDAKVIKPRELAAAVRRSAEKILQPR